MSGQGVDDPASGVDRDPQLLLPGVADCRIERLDRGGHPEWSGRHARFRRVLPRCDLGGPELHRPACPVELARIVKQLGPAAQRESPIRDRVLVFLAAAPRSPSEVATHIARPVPTATGHLCAMIRLGLVRRVGSGAYALANYAGEIVERERRYTKAAPELRAHLRSLLQQRQPLHHLSAATGQPARVVVAALRDMWLSGVVTGTKTEGYWLIAAVRRAEQLELSGIPPRKTRPVRKPTP